MTTKLQPTNLDPTLNYSMNQLSANTVLDGGVEILVVANSAYTQANTATTNAATADSKAVISGNYANSAFATANNNTTNITVVGSYANSAYIKANTAGTDSIAFSFLTAGM